MPNLDEPLTVTLSTACELTGLSRVTLWRRIKAKTLKAKCVGGRTLVEFASLKALVTGPDEKAA